MEEYYKCIDLFSEAHNDNDNDDYVHYYYSPGITNQHYCIISRLMKK